jgi:iron complex outermembrane receptor protein
MRKIIFFIIVLLFSQSVLAQISLSGHITDKNTGEKLPGVNIYIPELQKGSITDEKGYYQFKYLPKGNFKVQYSFVGYSKIIKTVNITQNPTVLDIAMQEESILAEEVVVSGGTYSTQHENAIKIESLSAEKLKMADSPSFIEAIAQAPGVDAISKGVGIATPVIRGLSLSNVLMLNNGVRMENFQFSEDHPFMINEAGVDRVEIIKGPASLLYGSDAVGGVINIIDEKPPASGKFITDASVNYFSNTQGINSDIGFKATTKNNLFFTLRGGLKSHADYYEGGGSQVPNSRFNNEFIKFNSGINKSYGKFSIRYNFDRMKLGLTVPPAIILTGDDGRKNKFWYQDLTNHFLLLNNILFLGQTKLELNLAAQQNIRKLNGSDLMPQFILVDMKLNTLNYELKSYSNLWKNSELIMGFQGMYQQNTNGNAPDHVLPDYTLNNVSIYSLLKYKTSEKLNIQFGLRYDLRYINVPDQLKTGIPDDSSYLDKLKTSYNNLSGSIGATYNVNKQLLLRANVATAYRTPNIAELTQDGMHGNRYEQGNRNLVPQRSTESDISMHYHTKHFIFDIAGFYNQINDYIYLAPTNDTVYGGYKIYRYEQNNADIHGVETGLAYQKNWFASKISYAYLRGKQKNGENLPFIPQNKINANIDFNKTDFTVFKDVKFRISGVYAFAQDYPAQFETETSSYFVLNSSLNFKINVNKHQKLVFKIFANNIFDKQYYDHLSTLKDLGYYAIGRNIGVGIRYLFK